MQSVAHIGSILSAGERVRLAKTQKAFGDQKGLDSWVRQPKLLIYQT